MTLIPEQHQQRLNGVDLCWFRWRGSEPALAPVLLVHATGFHARCWDQVVKHLPGREVIAVDMRGHGRSGKDEPITWDTFGRDLIALVQHLGLSGAVGVGHSMGGHSLVQAAAAEPDAFCRLLLVDPVIMAPEVYEQRQDWGDGAEHPTAKRRNRWQSWQEMFERFRDRKPFASWDPAVLEDYCRWGILPDPESGEGWILACPPKVEAAIYMGSSGRNVHELLPGISAPVTVLRARPRTGDRDTMDFSSSPTWPELAQQFPDGRDVLLEEHSHFIPMEAPARVAAFILEGSAGSRRSC